MGATKSHRVTEEELADEVWEDESPAAAGTHQGKASPSPSADTRTERSATGWRTERDGLGEIEVPTERLWGAQTERSRRHFAIGTLRMPLEVVHAYGWVKQAAAITHARMGLLPPERADAIAAACQELTRGQLDDEFPLGVFQTGSGTHTHANVNEVLAHRASQILRAKTGTATAIHPSDEVNLGQSTNDTFVTTMHLAAIHTLHESVLPALGGLVNDLQAKAAQWATIPKSGRTHLMDATSLTVGQEWSGYAASLDASRRHVIASMHDLHELAMGGTAVGTGLGASAGFAEDVIAELASLTGYPLRRANDHFGAQSTLDAMVRSHGSLKSVAVTLFKIANDLRWAASGPRHGLGEFLPPELEPGSTMMPGKVNPAQAEAVLMVCIQVFGNDVIAAHAGAEGNFELNAFRPVTAHSYFQSAQLLSDASRSLGHFYVSRLELGPRLLSDKATSNPVEQATLLAQQVGHEVAARIARHAAARGNDVLSEALEEGVPLELIDRIRALA